MSLKYLSVCQDLYFVQVLSFCTLINIGRFTWCLIISFASTGLLHLIYM